VATAVRGLTTGITILVFLGLLLALSWPLTLVAAGLLAGVTLVNQMSVARSRQYGEALSDASKHYSIALLDVLTGMRLVRAAATEEQEYARLRRRVRDRERAEYQSLASSAAIAPLSEVVGVVALILIVWIGRTFLAAEMQTLSTVLLTFLLLLFRMLPLLGQLNTARNQFANALPSIQQTQAFLNHRDKPFMQNGSIPFTGLRQGIRFREVSFGYVTGDRASAAEPDRLVLEQISLCGTSQSGWPHSASAFAASRRDRNHHCQLGTRPRRIRLDRQAHSAVRRAELQFERPDRRPGNGRRAAAVARGSASPDAIARAAPTSRIGTSSRTSGRTSGDRPPAYDPSPRARRSVA